MQTFLIDFWPMIVGVAVITAMAAFLVFRGKKSAGVRLGLEELVTLDSRGWTIMLIVAVFGAVVMIGSSAALGVAYWTGLAINADVTSEVINPADAVGRFGFLEYATVGVVSYFFLAITFELFSDLGTPMASGLKQRRLGVIPQLVFVATVGCIGMSLVTKWGYYDDKRDVRRVETAQTVIEDGRWITQRDEAQAAIDRLSGVPSVEVAEAKAAAAASTIETLKAQIAGATSARDALPATHSTNRARAQEGIDDLSAKLSAAQEVAVEVAVIKSDLLALRDAKAARDEALDHIKETAGKTLEGGQERTRAGDLLVVRIMRVGLHQFLCWLFPLIAFESFAARDEALRKEEALRKRRKTVEDKKNTIDDPDYVDLGPVMIDAKPYYDERAASEEEEVEEIKRERGEITDIYDDGADFDDPEAADEG